MRIKVLPCLIGARVLKRPSALIAGAEPVSTIGVVLDADNPNLAGKWDAFGLITAPKRVTGHGRLSGWLYFPLLF
jgi:hypothetical protein